MGRKDDILRVVDEMAVVHHDWIESDSESITEEFSDSVDSALAAFGVGDIPSDCRPMFVCAENLAGIWERWYTDVSSTGDSNILPGNDFWAAMDSIYDARRDSVWVEPRPIEPIAQLEKSGANDWQICKIYEWMTPEGVPDDRKLAEERANPGTHTGATFIHPLVRMRNEEKIKQNAARRVLLDRQAAKIERLSATVPETLEELLDMGMSARQMSKCLRITPEAIFAQCDELNRPHPPMDYPDLHTVRAPAEPEIHESVHRSMDAEQANPTRAVRPEAANTPQPTGKGSNGPVPVEDRIAAMVDVGKSADAICAELKADNEVTINVSKRRVEAIIKQFVKDKATA